MTDEESRPKLHIEGDWKNDADAAQPQPAGGQQPDAPDLQVDADWKAQAQAEKERLDEQVAEKSKARPSAGERELPEASFRTLVSMLASQAIMGLGAMADQKTGGVIVDLEGARLSIDLLQVLEEKTKGNLDDEESKELTQLLRELQARYVQISHLVAEQAASGGLQQPGEGAGGPVTPG